MSEYEKRKTRKWRIGGIVVKPSDRPHSTCCACNCVSDLIKELRAKIAKLESRKEDIMSGEGP